MLRLARAALLLLVTACGGGGSADAEAPKAEQLSAGEKCIRAANVAQKPPVDAPERIDVVHIVVKHDQVKGAIKEDIIRTREEACLRALEAREFLLAQNDWDAGYEKYSDGGGAMQGALEGISQTDVEEPFANAAFSLGVNELSHVVETRRGFHVILRKN